MEAIHSGDATEYFLRCVFSENQSLNVATCAGVAWYGDGGFLENNVFYRSYQEYPVLNGSAVAIGLFSYGVLYVRNNVFMESSGSPAIVTEEDSVFQTISDCNVFWENADGDVLYVQMGPGDRVIDPEFCGASVGDFTLHESSPCLPQFSDGCGLIGVYGPMCDDIAVEPKSWGKIKSLYR